MFENVTQTSFYIVKKKGEKKGKLPKAVM